MGHPQVLAGVYTFDGRRKGGPPAQDQVLLWKEYLIDIKERLQAARANDPNFGDDKLNGVWNQHAPTKEYLLTGICGTDPNAFCRNLQ
jgi:hypothetical protein